MVRARIISTLNKWAWLDCNVVLLAYANRALYLLRKLNFFAKTSAAENSETLSAQTQTSLSNDTDSVCLVHECRNLEEYLETNFVSAILEDTCPHPQEVKEAIVSADHDLMLCQHAARADMSILVEVERAVGWSQL